MMHGQKNIRLYHYLNQCRKDESRINSRNGAYVRYK